MKIISFIEVVNGLHLKKSVSVELVRKLKNSFIKGSVLDQFGSKLEFPK